MRSSERCVQVRIRGRVQGVGYRYFAREQAVLLGLRGHVRNMPDGSVEVVAQGPATALASFLEQLRQGPAAGYVDSCEVSEWERDLPDEDFRIRF